MITLPSSLSWVSTFFPLSKPGTGLTEFEWVPILVCVHLRRRGHICFCGAKNILITSWSDFYINYLRHSNRNECLAQNVVTDNNLTEFTQFFISIFCMDAESITARCSDARIQSRSQSPVGESLVESHQSGRQRRLLMSARRWRCPRKNQHEEKLIDDSLQHSYWATIRCKSLWLVSASTGKYQSSLLNTYRLTGRKTPTYLLTLLNTQERYMQRFDIGGARLNLFDS